jgi:hypothetical protein
MWCSNNDRAQKLEEDCERPLEVFGEFLQRLCGMLDELVEKKRRVWEIDFVENDGERRSGMM